MSNEWKNGQAKVSIKEFIRLSLTLDVQNYRWDNDYFIAVSNLLADEGHTISSSAIRKRVIGYRNRGLLPLKSGNSTGINEVLRGTSTLYDEDGKVKIQWVKTDVDKENQLEAYKEVLSDLAKSVQGQYDRKQYVPISEDNGLTLYISNDIHFGALMWKPESGVDWDLSIATQTVTEAYDYLFRTSPNSRVGVICDLGDLMEIDDFKNATPNSGNALAVDGRYPKVMKAAYSALIYAVEQALDKHEEVKFVNISGNHDITTGHAIREIVSSWFRNEPRVIVDESPSAIKYLQHGKTLIGFAHGDGLKMNRAGEVMACDNEKTFSDTVRRYFHFGHTHKDAVNDGILCRSESHRNLAPLNDWAYHKGFRRQYGTMKSITYSMERGEISRNLYNIGEEE